MNEHEYPSIVVLVVVVVAVCVAGVVVGKKPLVAGLDGIIKRKK